MEAGDFVKHPFDALQLHRHNGHSSAFLPNACVPPYCAECNYVLRAETEINDPHASSAVNPAAQTCGVKYEQEASLFRCRQAHHILPQRSLWQAQMH